MMDFVQIMQVLQCLDPYHRQALINHHSLDSFQGESFHLHLLHHLHHLQLGYPFPGTRRLCQHLQMQLKEPEHKVLSVFQKLLLMFQRYLHLPMAVVELELKSEQLVGFMLLAKFELVVVSMLLVVNYLLVSLLVRLPMAVAELLGL